MSAGEAGGVARRGIDDLREAQLSFIGKILATLSHELKNHLAIIKEYSGLVQDLAEMGKAPNAGSADQCVNAVRCIHRQIDGTLALLTHFNRFSHRMDTGRSLYAVNEAVDELLALTHRLANQRKISVERVFQEGLPLVAGNPALLQFSLFCLLQDALARLESNGTIVVRTGTAESAVTITLLAQGALGDEGPQHPACCGEARLEALRRIGGAGSQASAGGEVTLTIPLAEAEQPDAR